MRLCLFFGNDEDASKRCHVININTYREKGDRSENMMEMKTVTVTQNLMMKSSMYKIQFSPFPTNPLIFGFDDI